MKIDNQDIIRTARQLRDKENEQLHVSPWNHHRHFHVPTWLVAIPAAAIIGFVLGLWTQANTNSDTSLTALVDTVYIKVPTPQPQQDSVAQTVPAILTPTVTKMESSHSVAFIIKCLWEKNLWNFPGGPVVKTLHFQCRGHGFDP